MNEALLYPMEEWKEANWSQGMLRVSLLDSAWCALRKLILSCYLWRLPALLSGTQRRPLLDNLPRWYEEAAGGVWSVREARCEPVFIILEVLNAMCSIWTSYRAWGDNCFRTIWKFWVWSSWNEKLSVWMFVNETKGPHEQSQEMFGSEQRDLRPIEAAKAKGFFERREKDKATGEEEDCRRSQQNISRIPQRWRLSASKYRLDKEQRCYRRLKQKATMDEENKESEAKWCSTA